MDSTLNNWRIMNGLKETIASKIKLLRIINYNNIDNYVEMNQTNGDKYGVFIITTDDDVYTFGENNDHWLDINQFGIINSDNPIKIEELCDNGVIDIAAGYKHVIAMTSNGRIFSWGWSDCGQLGDK
jgi:alpha-tubulin suppressor-like RCC1 family protein